MDVHKISEEYARQKNVAAAVRATCNKDAADGDQILEQLETDNLLQDKCFGVLLGSFSAARQLVLSVRPASVCGDVLGANTEFMSMDKIRQKFGKVRDFKHSTQRPLGQYTDDGESLLALAVAVVKTRGHPTLRACTDQYCKVFLEPPRRGYGPTSSRILTLLASHQVTPDVSGTMFFPEGSYSNGCLMRVAVRAPALPFSALLIAAQPIGLLAALRRHDDATVEFNVGEASRMTHCHVEALQVCKIYCMLLRDLALDPTLPDDNSQARGVALWKRAEAACEAHASVEFFREKLAIAQGAMDALLATASANQQSKDDVSDDDVQAKEREYFTSLISECPFGELFAIRACEAFLVSVYVLALSGIVGPEEALIRCVNWGGDADTVACIAGGLLGALYGSKWLPARWLTKLEDFDVLVSTANAMFALTNAADAETQ